jgi:glutathionyl-hydroquinone reductase
MASGMMIEGKWTTNWNERDRSGKFNETPTTFRDWVSADGKSGFKAEVERYHLYVSLACPWAHRTLIMRELKGLNDAISVSIVDPIMSDLGWMFSSSQGAIPDSVNYAQYLQEIYLKADPKYTGRVTVPVLWDKQTQLFESLDRWETVLSKQRYLCGDRLTEADICMFTTLYRFDSIYYSHFKCNLRRILDYPNLWNYLKDLYQRPEFKVTCNLDYTKRAYYMSMTEINPNGIVPSGPIIDFDEWHDRDRLGLA